MIHDQIRDGFDVAFYVPRLGALLSSEIRDPAGGAETQVVLLARALAQEGVKVKLIVFQEPGITLPALLDGVTVAQRPPYRTREPLGRIRETARIAAAMVASAADVVVTRGATPEVGPVAIFTKVTGRRFVYASANVSDFREMPKDIARSAESGFDYSRFPRKRLDNEMFRVAIRLADDVVVQSNEQVVQCERRFGRSATLIRSIAEPAPQRMQEAEAFLWIARLVSYKRPLAYVDLARALPEARFWMIAPDHDSPDWELAETLRRAVAEVDNLELLAPRPRTELLKLVDRAVAVVNTADFEGMPNVFLEGWARGVPALALAHDPDSVIERHGLGGFANGDPDVLVEIARRLWLGRREQGGMADRCRQYIAEHHSPGIVAARWKAVLGV
jgi:glycosyltransferase involved in cell wall biosynthesis